jgi:hypothetical protein
VGEFCPAPCGFDEPRHTVATNAIRNAFLAVGDTEEARTFAASYLQIGAEASYDGLNVAEIATKIGLIVVGQ